MGDRNPAASDAAQGEVAAVIRQMSTPSERDMNSGGLELKLPCCVLRPASNLKVGTSELRAMAPSLSIPLFRAVVATGS